MEAPPVRYYNYIIPTTTEQVFDFFPSPPPVEASHGPFKMDVIKAVDLIKLNLTPDLAWWCIQKRCCRRPPMQASKQERPGLLLPWPYQIIIRSGEAHFALRTGSMVIRIEKAFFSLISIGKKKIIALARPHMVR